MFTTTQRAIERRVAAYFSGFDREVDRWGGTPVEVTAHDISDAVDVYLGKIEHGDGVVLDRDGIDYDLADAAYDEVVACFLSGRRA